MAVNIHGFRLKQPEENDDLKQIEMVHKWLMDWKQFTALAALLLCIAFGAIFMGWEQKRANSGFFIEPPTTLQSQPPPSAKEF